MKSQISKLTGALAIQEHDKFPSQAQSNSKGQHMAQTSHPEDHSIKELNVITTRSGKILEGLSTNATTASGPEEVAPRKDETTKQPVKVPFPQDLHPAQKALDGWTEILEHLTQVKINLPLLHVIKQVLAYAKVIKDLCTLKQKHYVKKTIFLVKQVSAVIKQKAPPKYKDPGCPMISC